MNLSLSTKETRTLIEMLTISGYMMTQVSDHGVSKAEQMHELIQKIYQKAQQEDDAFKDSFDHDEEAKMIFPNASIMADGPDSPLYMLKSYNEFAAADILSQHLGIVETTKALNMSDDQQSELSPEFMEEFSKKRDAYLKEFIENGFHNIQVNKSIVS